MEKRKQGRPVTGIVYKPFSIAVTDEQLAKIKFIADQERRSVAFIVRGMIDDALLVEK